MEDILRVGGLLATVIGVPMLVLTVIPLVGKALGERLSGRVVRKDLELEVEDLRSRVQELEEREARIAELEERLDFAERVLAKRDEHLLQG